MENISLDNNAYITAARIGLNLAGIDVPSISDIPVVGSVFSSISRGLGFGGDGHHDVSFPDITIPANIANQVRDIPLSVSRYSYTGTALGNTRRDLHALWFPKLNEASLRGIIPESVSTPLARLYDTTNTHGTTPQNAAIELQTLAGMVSNIVGLIEQDKIDQTVMSKYLADNPNIAPAVFNRINKLDVSQSPNASFDRAQIKRDFFGLLGKADSTQITNLFSHVGMPSLIDPNVSFSTLFNTFSNPIQDSFTDDLSITGLPQLPSSGLPQSPTLTSVPQAIPSYTGGSSLQLPSAGSSTLSPSVQPTLPPNTNTLSKWWNRFKTGVQIGSGVNSFWNLFNYARDDFGGFVGSLGNEYFPFLFPEEDPNVNNNSLGFQGNDPDNPNLSLNTLGGVGESNSKFNIIDLLPYLLAGILLAMAVSKKKGKIK